MTYSSETLHPWQIALGCMTFHVSCEESLYSIQNELLGPSRGHLRWLEEDQINNFYSGHQPLTEVRTRSCSAIQVKHAKHSLLLV